MMDLNQRFSKLAVFLLLIFPISLLIFTTFFYTNTFAYLVFMLEGIFPAEMGTFLLLLGSSFLSFSIFRTTRRNWGISHWFFVFLGLFFFLAALEEVSYGQSFFAWNTPEFFNQINNQRETNFHNVLFAGPQGQSLRLKHVAGMVAIAYGVILPLLPTRFFLRRLLHRFQVIQPPLWLLLPFLLTGIISFYDRPSGQEEELGEFMMSIGLFVTVWLNWRITRQAQSIEQLQQERFALSDPAPLYQAFQSLPEYIRRLFFGFTGLTLGLAVLHVASAYDGLTGFTGWFFSMESIYGGAGVLFLLQSMLIGVALFVLSAFSGSWLQSAYQVGAICFWFAALVYKYHFALQFGLPYNAFSALTLTVSFILLALSFSRENINVLLLILTGGGLIVAGYWQHLWDLRQSQMAVYFSMMLVGTSVLLVCLLFEVHQKLSESLVRVQQRLAWGGTAALFVGLIAVTWVIPTVEGRMLAQPLRVDYLDGDLSLIGYRLEDDLLTPGESVEVTLYWQANASIPTGYGASLNLLTQPDITSLAADNIPLLHWMNTDAWVPGFVMRQKHTIQIPANVDTPAGLLVQGTVWWADNGEEIPLTNNGEQRQLSDAAFVLDRVTVAGSESVPELVQSADYAFGDGFTLSSYAIPETANPGDVITLDFAWNVEADIQRDLTQFLHLYPEGVNEYTAAFDHPPLNGRFPSLDWRAGVQFEDNWQIALPEDLSPGEYTLYTGMYEPLTVARVPILTESDQVSDNRIILGKITIR